MATHKLLIAGDKFRRIGSQLVLSISFLAHSRIFVTADTDRAGVSSFATRAHVDRCYRSDRKHTGADPLGDCNSSVLCLPRRFLA
jgi:hypothetical protein